MKTLRSALLAPLAAAALLQPVASSADSIPDLYSQHLDFGSPSYCFSAAYQTDTEFGPYGTTDIIEGDVALNLGQIDGILYGSLGVLANAHAFYFVDNPNMSSLPDSLMDAYLEPYFLIRFMEGWSWRFAARPGIYSDTTAPEFGVPILVEAYFAASPAVSFVIGGQYRPGWDIPFIPNVGVIFGYEDLLRVELGCPRSRIDLFPTHILSFFAEGEWSNVTYALDDGNGVPEDLTWDEIKVSAGASLRILGTWVVTGEIGTYLERELSADVAENHAMDLSKEPFVRVSLSSSF